MEISTKDPDDPEATTFQVGGFSFEAGGQTDYLKECLKWTLLRLSFSGSWEAMWENSLKMSRYVASPDWAREREEGCVNHSMFPLDDDLQRARNFSRRSRASTWAATLSLSWQPPLAEDRGSWDPLCRESCQTRLIHEVPWEHEDSFLEVLAFSRQHNFISMCWFGTIGLTVRDKHDQPVLLLQFDILLWREGQRGKEKLCMLTLK